jgi:hypothetical protein
MKRIATERLLQAGIYACVFLLGYFLINSVGTLFHLKDVSAAAANADTDKYMVRSRLLMEATDATGACSPEAAASVWARGVQQRSAALQYAVMTVELKDIYEAQLETTFPNWVTGVSSPWIDNYNVELVKQSEDGDHTFRVTFTTATSTGPAGSYAAMLTVTGDGDYWRVSAISADKGLSAYTGFMK